MHLSVEEMEERARVLTAMRGDKPSGQDTVEDTRPDAEGRHSPEAMRDEDTATVAGSIALMLSQEIFVPLLERMTALEKQIQARGDLAWEHQRLHEELRQKDREIAQKNMEIEKLRRDMSYQKRVHEKELEDQKASLQEKWALLEKEAAERLALEREEFARRLELEQRLWTEKLEKEKERSAQQLAEVQQQEGFWSKLVRMMTWS